MIFMNHVICKLKKINAFPGIRFVLQIIPLTNGKNYSKKVVANAVMVGYIFLYLR
jgi:hypothetical protein